MSSATAFAILIGLSASAAMSSAALASEQIPLARTPSDMSGSEIDAHNHGLALTDANYIKCRRIELTGSLVRKLRVCNTNSEWKRIGDKSNQDARDTMEQLARGWSNAQEPREQLLSPAPGRPQ